jgi:hypothetical protein
MISRTLESLAAIRQGTEGYFHIAVLNIPRAYQGASLKMRKTHDKRGKMMGDERVPDRLFRAERAHLKIKLRGKSRPVSINRQCFSFYRGPF